ncbi:MAG: hypothetical protein ACI3T9_05910 [Romboutsia timonensis]
MKQITEFTSSAFQTCKLPLETRESVDFKLYFAPTQLSWYFDFTYNDIVSNGNKLSLGYNLLRAFKGRIPFGLLVEGDGNIEPFAIDDFSTGRVKVYILNQEEVDQIESVVFYD